MASSTEEKPGTHPVADDAGDFHKAHTQVYWEITALCERLLYACEWAGLEVWPEYGTLIGYARHNGVIPWDYDADFGMWLEDRDRLVEAFRSANSDGKFVISETEYNDIGCLYICPEGRGDVVGLDVVFYVKDEAANKVRSAMSPEIISQFRCPRNYEYDLNQLLPLRKGVFLGFQTYLPHNVEWALRTVFGDWHKCPPDQLPKYSPHLLAPPLAAVEERSDIRTLEDLAKCLDGPRATPLICRNTDILNVSREGFAAALIAEPSVWGYDDAGAPETTGKKLWEAYEAKRLKFNVVDSPVSDPGLRDPQAAFAKSRGVHFEGRPYDYSLTWIATNQPKRTYFHLDPPYGGGFMKLIEGEKIWWIIPERHTTEMLHRGHSEEKMSKMLLSELLQLENGYLYGKIEIGVIRGGDLLWFPQGSIHAVLTTEDSCGLGGYLA